MQNYDRVKEDEYGKHYYLGSYRHRLDGPSIEWINGDKSWYKDGLLHRENSPAIELVDGEKWWYQNGKRHRIDGPAVDTPEGFKRWYIEGEEYTFKEWLGLVWNSLSEDNKKEYIFEGFDEEL